MMWPLIAVLLLSTVQAGKLYYNPGHSTVCPEGFCTYGTCCKDHSDLKCCSIKNAVCCSDNLHCCPLGTTCDIQKSECIENGLKKEWYNTTSAANHFQSSNEDEFDSKLDIFDNVFFHENPSKGSPKCLSNHTTCPLANGDLGCCQYKNAVCCIGGEGLCCPNGHTCNPTTKTCEKPAIKVTNTDPMLKSISDIICPDAQTTCSSNTTCCCLADGEYGCCPYPNAVCCSDHLHCCPHNSTCDISGQICILKDRSIPFGMSSTPARRQWKTIPQGKGHNLGRKSPAVGVRDTLCPDNSSCSENDTCCAMNTGVWGCCSYKHAVCCADYKHCCPQNFICDLNEERCVKNRFAFSFFSDLKPAKQIRAASVAVSTN